MNNGEIWLINLDPTVGSEIQKTRPAVIVNHDAIGSLPLKVIVPITDWKPHYCQVPWMVRVSPNSNNNLRKESALDTFQIRSVSEKRLLQCIGIVDPVTMQEIKIALKRVLDIE